jgi:hypothetical protein
MPYASGQPQVPELQHWRRNFQKLWREPMWQKDIDVLPSGHLGQGLEQVMQVGARLKPRRLGGLCRPEDYAE